MALPKNNRLKRKRDFESVFKQGRSVAGSFLFLKWRRSPMDRPRFAFVVSGKVARKAVIRNQVRRVLSEAVRRRLKGAGPRDTIVVVTKMPPDGSLNVLKDDLTAVLEKISS